MRNTGKGISIKEIKRGFLFIQHFDFRKYFRFRIFLASLFKNLASIFRLRISSQTLQQENHFIVTLFEFTILFAECYLPAGAGSGKEFTKSLDKENWWGADKDKKKHLFTSANFTRNIVIIQDSLENNFYFSTIKPGGQRFSFRSLELWRRGAAGVCS